MKPPTTEEAMSSQCSRMDIRLAAWPKLSRWRATLGQKAKQEKRYRFYTLYQLISHPETLAAAWAIVESNGGACGIDRVSVEQIAQSEESTRAFLDETRTALVTKTYRAAPVRRVYIPKANGKQRPLGIPTVRDRVVQCAVKLIVEPIFEADFKDCSYGFRPGRKAHDALDSIRQGLKAGLTAIYDADLASYFDTIAHDKLMLGLRQRIVDGSVLDLIRQWLRAPIAEPLPSQSGRSHRYTMTRNTQGTPQGGVLSPLLANLHLHWFDRAFLGPNGPAVWAKARLVRYADDFVIMAKHISPRLEAWITETLEGRLGLKLNPDKTRIVSNLSDKGKSLDFLGFRFENHRDLKGRPWTYWQVGPSPTSVKRERSQIKLLTDTPARMVPLIVTIQRINRQIIGWKGYFNYGYPRTSFNKINSYVQLRLFKHMRRKSQRRWKPPSDRSPYKHFKHLGLHIL